MCVCFFCLTAGVATYKIFLTIFSDSHKIIKTPFGDPMKNCSTLYFLSTLACQLSDCMSDDEIAILAADLVVLSDMLANIAARNSICSPDDSTV